MPVLKFSEDEKVIDNILSLIGKIALESQGNRNRILDTEVINLISELLDKA